MSNIRNAIKKTAHHFTSCLHYAHFWTLDLLSSPIFTCFIAKLKKTLLQGLKIKLKLLHKPPTSPVSWEVLSVKWAQAIYFCCCESWKTISLWCSPSLVSRELSAFNLFMYCTVLYVNRRQGERRKIVVEYKSWTSKLWGRWLKGRHEEAVSIVSSIVPESQ